MAKNKDCGNKQLFFLSLIFLEAGASAWHCLSLFFELGQKFLFPVKAAKESNFGGRCAPGSCATESTNLLGLWCCRHHYESGEC